MYEPIFKSGDRVNFTVVRKTARTVRFSVYEGTVELDNGLLVWVRRKGKVYVLKHPAVRHAGQPNALTESFVGAANG